MWVLKKTIFFIVLSCEMQLWTVFGQRPNYRSRRSPEGISPRIIQGRPAKADEVPWNLQLLYKGDFLCSAALVQSVETIYHFALTSAKCLNPQDGAPIDEKRLEVVAGVVDRTAGIEPAQERERVREVIRHPTYEKQDIAFLLLDRQFAEKETVKPMALPTRPEFYPKDYTPLTVAGWGSSVKGDNDHRSNHLQIKVIETCSFSDCKAVHSFDWGIGEIYDTELCAWDVKSEGYHGVCNGDQGAAAVAVDDQTEFRYLAGIYSRVHGKCGDNKLPSLFVRVSSVLNWVLEVDKKKANEYNTKP